MSTQLSDNSKLIAKFNIVDIYERNRISRWLGYQVVPHHQGYQQTADSNFRQTDDILSYLRVDARRHQRDIDNQYAIRFARLQATAWRWQ